MENLTKINENIHRLTMPYKEIFTTVYTLWAPGGVVLFDAASYDEDLQAYILPLLSELGITADRLKYVFISHNHRDHAGGLEQFIKAFPKTTIVSRCPRLKEKYKEYSVLAPEEGDVLLDTFRVVTIPGHTEDSSALFDMRTGTLISGDCLQLYGICGSEDWGANIGFPVEYLAAIDKLRAMDIEAIITAHDYYPYGYKAGGREEVARMLDACVEPLMHIKELICAKPQLEDAEIRSLYNAKEGIPTISLRVTGAMRAALEAGSIK